MLRSLFLLNKINGIFKERGGAMKPSVKFFFIVVALGISTFLIMKYRAPLESRTAKFLKEDKDAAEEMKIIGLSKNANPRVKELQEHLFKMGYGVGAIDGKMGKATREAIKKFQREHQLAPTGKVNKKTFLELQRKVLKNSQLLTKDIIKPKKIVIDGKIDPLSIKEKIKEIQKMLKALGVYDGKIDGIMGKGTIEAIQKIERSLRPATETKKTMEPKQKKKLNK